jgi:hypothetical protein
VTGTADYRASRCRKHERRAGQLRGDFKPAPNAVAGRSRPWAVRFLSRSTGNSDVHRVSAARISTSISLATSSA